MSGPRSRAVVVVLGVAALALLAGDALAMTRIGGAREAPAGAAGATGAAGAAGGGLVPGAVQVLSVASPEAGTAPRTVWVWRPRIPDSRSLPVLYFLHGVPGSAGDPFHNGLADFLDRYVSEGGLPVVVASPDGNSPARADTEWADSADRRSELETFVVDRVIPAVEGRLRRDRAHRAIAGFSMGAYGAANLALRHPNLFGQTVPVAGYFHIDDPSGVFDHDRALLAANSPDAHVASARRLHILLLDGDKDGEPVVQGEALRFKGLLDAAHIPAELHIAPGSHDWAYVQTQYPDIFRFLESYWRALVHRRAPAAPRRRTRR